jgi:hypothetical protein
MFQGYDCDSAPSEISTQIYAAIPESVGEVHVIFSLSARLYF